MSHGSPMTLGEVGVSLDFGIIQIDTTWVRDPRQRNAAWALYVELVTRTAIQDLDLDQGVLREALSSLYALFAITREILREQGPVVGAGPSSVGGIAIAVLNKAVRPFLTKWHPALADWEAKRAEGVSALAHERAWDKAIACRGELRRLQTGLVQYARALARIADAGEP